MLFSKSLRCIHCILVPWSEKVLCVRASTTLASDSCFVLLGVQVDFQISCTSIGHKASHLSRPGLKAGKLFSNSSVNEHLRFGMLLAYD